MDRPLPWLRYVAAGDLDDLGMGFEKMEVNSPSNEHLGHVDGFIVDRDSARPYYVVVDSGGWFRSKHFLMPIGHVQPDSTKDDGSVLIADIAKERIRHFPGFDLKAFEKFSEADLKRFNDQTCEACAITVVTYSSSEPYSAAWDREHYRYPDWWHAEPSLPDRMGESAPTKGAEYPEKELTGKGRR